MTDYQILNSTEHQHLRVITRRASELGDAMMHCPTYPFEFRNVQAEYPIVFHRDGDGDYQPVALFGFEPGENLFLNEDGWNANYIPAMVRREPFLISYQQSEQPDGIDSRFVAINLRHPRISPDEGEPLFVQGSRSAYLQELTSLLDALYEGVGHARRFVATLQQHDLIENVSMEITLNNGSVNQLLGFAALDEDKIQNLSGEVLGELNKSGFVMPMYMMLASMTKMRTLIDLKNRKLEQDSRGSPF